MDVTQIVQSRIRERLIRLLLGVRIVVCVDKDGHER
jgi:hypothetical protein